MESQYLYLMINLGAWLPPFLLSFDKKVAYFRRWRYLFPSILIVGVVFIVWDILFTRWGVWGFNDTYLSGIKIVNLPLGEWLFFITIPYASVFIYDCIKAYFPHWEFPEKGIVVARILALLLLFTGLFFFGRIYTSVTFILLSIMLLILAFRKVSFLGRFFISYLVILIPFMIVNGILTGSGIPQEVVWYDNGENLGIRLITIPVEDVFYGMLLILGNVTCYEYFQGKKSLADGS